MINDPPGTKAIALVQEPVPIELTAAPWKINSISPIDHGLKVKISKSFL
jgi:hypothetical protein